ncbi:hypothetical protein C365_00480 [Cryptococcus neoformans Bt85]|nr:hypothetical protein C365_00480 [Cryptococcus neoformans var. grubii Bt85]OXM81514.1 hypothetical protein C364_00483 [Cryptococcus neoformans var. grubii Bt63]
MMTMFRIKTGLIVPFLLLVTAIFIEQVHATGQEDDTKALQRVRKLIHRQGTEDAGSVTDSGIASAIMSESITASFGQTSQAATSVTSLDPSSANSATSRVASSSSVTGSVPFASSFASLAEPSTNCTGPGGGCVVFLSSVSSCSEDSCACDLSYPAQVCAQCLASEEAIDSFNSFLKTCEDAGYVAPTSTVLVEVKYCEEQEESALASETYSGLTAVSLTDTAKITATEDMLTSGEAVGTLPTATMASTSAFATETGDKGVVAVEINDGNYSDTILSPFTSNSNATANTFDAIPAASKSSALNNMVALATDSISELSASGAASIVVITSYSTIPHTATLFSPSGSARVSDMGTFITGASTLSGAIFTQDEPDIGALNSAHEFFNSDVLSNCSNDCKNWQRMAQTCTEDSCICTSDGLSAASTCSSCIGSQSSNSTTQMRAYAAFTSNCTSASSLSDAFGSRTSAGGLTFGGEATSSAGANPFITASSSDTSVNAEEANGAATTIVVAGAGLRNVDWQPIVAIVVVVTTMACHTIGLYVA